jgi:two-component system C4-dicarboxylate transport response regulator DctD
MASVLIIDDEVEVSLALRRVLERAGFQVTTCLSAAEGVASFKDAPTDVVITDIIMPKMNGVAVLQQIRAHRPQTGIIAISGGGNFGPLDYRPEAITTSAYLAAATQAGADAVLTKPFDKDELLKTVRRILDQR